jgi:uncharacterized Zn-binding protein involved in type VI secretion
MVKYRNKFIAAAGVVVAAGAVAVSGLTAASASPAASHPVSGTEQFQIVNGSATAHRAGVIATGIFTAAGIDLMGTTTDTLSFPGGTFQVQHSAGRGTQGFNPRTCLATINLRGTIRLGHGTGRYAGISGQGRYKLSILEVAARAQGKCSRTRPPAAFQQILQAQAQVHQ